MHYPDKSWDWPIPYDCVQEICNGESCRLTAYRCPANVLTIGWGDTDNVFEGEVITQDEADQRLLRQLKRFAAAVASYCKVKPNANQLGGMVSLAYNIGIGAFAKSSVLALHNKGNFLGAAQAFSLFNKARVNGKPTVLPGLVKRRAHEAARYLTPVANDAALDGAVSVIPAVAMPQEVADAPSLAKNPLAVTASVTGAGAALNAVSNAADQAQTLTAQVQNISSAVSGFFGLPTWVLVSLALGAVTIGLITYLHKQREAGVL